VLYVFVPLAADGADGLQGQPVHRLPDPVLDARLVSGVFADADVLFTFGYSIAIAVLSTLISVIVGVWLAVLLEGRKFVGRGRSMR
jgi:spermidine/putrescine transport system permease protein